MLSPFTHFLNLAPHGREGREREKAVHQGLPEESTAGFMDLLCLTAGGFCSRAGPGGLPAGADQDGRGSKEDLGSRKGFMLLPLTLHQPAGKAGYGASGVLHILMPHHIRCSPPVLPGSCDPARLHPTRGYGAVGLPQAQGELPTSAQLWLDLAT